MDIQTKKIKLISYITQIKDESFIDKIEKFVLQKSKEDGLIDFTPFTKEELNQRVAESEEDYKNDRYKTQDDIENLSDNW